MANWLEDLSKTVADEQLPRRVAMRRIAGGVTGVALAWIGIGKEYILLCLAQSSRYSGRDSSD